MATLEDFKKLEFKIGEICEVTLHPHADRLYVLKVNVGEAVKTLVAGIRPYYTSEELIGKKVVVVANLEPAVIRGVVSEGMLLAASAGESLALIGPDREIPLGTIVR